MTHEEAAEATLRSASSIMRDRVHRIVIFGQQRNKVISQVMICEKNCIFGGQRA